jgi:hypothetical protein
MSGMAIVSTVSVSLQNVSSTRSVHLVALMMPDTRLIGVFWPVLHVSFIQHLIQR